MPNHCNNVLFLTDDPSMTKKALKAFISKKEGDEVFDFDKVIKMPKDLDITSTTPNLDTKEGIELEKKQKENLKKYGAKDWYDWCIQNWGTKWNSYENYISDNAVGFQTAWAPPTPVISKLAEKTKKNWTLLYSEIGMDFCGKIIADASGEITEQQWTHKKAPKSFLNEMGITEDMIYSEEELEEKRKKKAKIKIKKQLGKKGHTLTIE